MAHVQCSGCGDFRSDQSLVISRSFYDDATAGNVPSTSFYSLSLLLNRRKVRHLITTAMSRNDYPLSRLRRAMDLGSLRVTR